MERKVIGDPKFGLTLRIRQSPTVMSLEARPDPLLLFVVIAASTLVGVVGSVVSSPREGVVSFLTFALLFAPLICALAFNAVRVRTLCVLDKERGLLEIDEQSYTRRVQEVYPLQNVAAVKVRRMPSGPLAGGGWNFGLFLTLEDRDYFTACSNNEATVGQDAWRISRFLGVSLEAPTTDEEPEPGRARLGLVVTTAVLYLLPVVLAISALLLLFDQLPGIEPRLAGLLGAVVISQIGAILAFAYQRTRKPHET